MAFVLKVLAGPHVGAEMMLNPGEYVIGSGEESDIIFADSSVLSQHAYIRIFDGSIDLKVLEGFLQIQKNRINSGESTKLETSTPVVIGTTSFVILKEGESWNEIPYLPPRDICADNTESRRAEDTTGSLEKDGEKHLENSEKQENPQSEKYKKAQKAVRAAGNRRTSALYAALIIVFIFVVLMSWGAWHYIRASIKATPYRSTPLPISQLEKILKREGFSELRIEKIGNTPVISGILNNDSEKQKLQEIARKFDKPVLVRVLTNDHLITTVKEILDRLVPNIVVESVKPGIIVLKGNVTSCPKIKRVTEIIKNDVVGIKDVENEVTCLDEVAKRVKQYLWAKGLSHSLKVHPSGHKIYITGHVKANQVSAWKEAAAFLDEKFKGLVIINVTVKPSKLNLITKSGKKVEHYDLNTLSDFSALPIDLENVESVVLGRKSFIVTRSGQKVYKGDKIGDKYIISDIGRNFIEVKTNNTKRKIYFKRPSIILEYHW